MTGWPVEGWLGAACLLLAGAGWGRQVSRRGVTALALGLTLLLSGLGLVLCAFAFVRGHPLPLGLGAAGSLALATLAVFGRRD